MTEQVTIDKLSELRYAFEEGFTEPMPPLMSVNFLEDYPDVKKRFQKDLVLTIGGLFHFLKKNQEDGKPDIKDMFLQSKCKDSLLFGHAMVSVPMPYEDAVELVSVSRKINMIDLSTGLIPFTMILFFLPHIDPMMEALKALYENEVPYDKTNEFFNSHDFTVGKTKFLGAFYDDETLKSLNDFKTLKEMHKRLKGN